MTIAGFGRAVWICEARPFALALALVLRGFRSRSAAGWPYSGEGLKPVAFIVLAVLTVPQALVLDLLFSHSPALRIVSAIVHVYAIVWTLALANAMYTEPHVVADGRATFRFPLLQSVNIGLAEIESLHHVARRPRGIPRFGLGKAGIIVRLKQPVRIDRPLLARPVSQLFVAADDIRSLERALSTSGETLVEKV